MHAGRRLSGRRPFLSTSEQPTLKPLYSDGKVAGAPTINHSGTATRHRARCMRLKSLNAQAQEPRAGTGRELRGPRAAYPDSVACAPYKESESSKSMPDTEPT